jgi:hypothetical protein
MTLHRRPRSRAHRRPLQLEFETEPFSLWLPDPDQPIVLADFAETATLAFELLELPGEREYLVLLDEHRVVTAIVVDPPPAVGVLIGSCEVPGLEVPFCQTICIVLVDRVVEGPPNDDDRRGYQSLRRMHVLQGLQLMDVVLVDGERVQSLAIACDPDPIWFEPFSPDAAA